MLRMFQLIGEADDLLENSWQQRNWPTFMRVWLLGSLWLTVTAFLMPFIFVYLPGSLWNAVAAVIGAKTFVLLFYDLFWNLALPFCAMVGLFTLIFTAPVMLLKQISGDFKAR
jgi:hypothetical protein